MGSPSAGVSRAKLGYNSFLVPAYGRAIAT
jgi:hypothetical protein